MTEMSDPPMTGKQKLIALSVITVAVIAYNSSGWYGAVRDWHQQRSEWRSENYRVAASKCYICFHDVDYWQKKGKSPRGADTVCGNCGHTNTYMSDTRPFHWCKGSVQGGFKEDCIRPCVVAPATPMTSVPDWVESVCVPFYEAHAKKILADKESAAKARSK